GALSTVLVLRDLDAAWQVCAILARQQDAAARCVVLATTDGMALLPNGLLHRPADEGAAALERTRELRRVEAEAQQAAQTLRQVEAAALAAQDESRQRASAAETALHVLRAAEHERHARRGEVTAAERAVAQARREADWAAERLRRVAGAAAERTRRRRELEPRLAGVRGGLSGLPREEKPAMARHDAARAALQE